MKRPLRIVTIVAAAGALLVGATLAMAAKTEKSAANKTAKTPVAAGQQSQQGAYLGVGIDRLGPEFASQLPDLFGGGQGVLVAQVLAGSPAQKAGIQPNDILMTYGNQKLFSPNQLVKLVGADTAGHSVALNVVRNGKPIKINVKLGARNTEDMAAQVDELPGPWRWLGRHRGMPAWSTNSKSPSKREQAWETFDSMSIKKLNNNRYKVDIGYLEKDGKVHHQEFEGTRPEIHKAIMTQKDLPAVERRQLLRTLDMPSDEFALPAVHTAPRGFWEFPNLDWSL